MIEKLWLDIDRIQKRCEAMQQHPAAWEIVADPVESFSSTALRGVGSLRLASTAGYGFDQLRYRAVAAASTTGAPLDACGLPFAGAGYWPSSGRYDAGLTEPTFELRSQTSTGGWVALEDGAEAVLGVR